MAARALELTETAFGPDHPNTAASLNNLALLYDYMGSYAKAEPLFQRALAINEEVFGPDHPATATSLINLGLLHLHMGSYPKAELLYQRALAINEKARGADHPETATSLNHLAQLHYHTGSYAKAEPLHLRALAIRENALGPDHPATATSLNNLALLYFGMGSYAKAEPLYQRALEIRERTLGPEHPDTSNSLNNLAGLYEHVGSYARAEPLYQRALAVNEKTLGADHPATATSLNNLAGLYITMGSYAKAEPLFERALAIREKTLGPDHPETATSLNNLAQLHHRMSSYAKAEPLYQRALAINEKTLGPDHPETATSLNNLAQLHYQTGSYAKAEPLYRRALATREKAFGPDHPLTATSLNNLAFAYSDMGDYTKAARLLRRALTINEKALGPDHPLTASSLDNVAAVLLDLEKYPEALALAKRALQAKLKGLAEILSFTSEQQRLAYQATVDPYVLLASIGDAPGMAEAVLHFKGIVLDSLLEDRLVAESSRDPQDRFTLRELQAAKQTLMQQRLEVPGDLAADAYARRLSDQQALEEGVERLEKTLADKVVGLGRIRTALAVTVQQVQLSVPSQAALVELVRYNHYLGQQRYEGRYGAVLLTPEGKPEWLPLGSAAELEANVSRAQQSVTGIPKDAETKSILQSLYQQIWAPIQAVLPPDTQTVIVSPDAALSFVSFATLLTPGDEFLATKYSLRYVASGRDLLRPIPSPPPGPQLTLYSNADFAGGAPRPSTASPGDDSPLRALDARDLEAVHLAPLPGTARESEAITTEATGWGWKVEHFEEKEATEARLRTIRSPWVLHLATHGFFLDDGDVGGTGESDNRRGAIGWAGGVGFEGRPVGRGGASVVLRNPMYRSGLALAGAEGTLNEWKAGRTPPTETDGIVTAAEVGDLRLSGTWLVTLSACDTGAGEARPGEGVLGLRRGFVQAGTQNLLMTLWAISDQQTAKLMVDFYRMARREGNASKALAEVQRDWLVRLRKQRGLAMAVRVAGPFVLTSQGPLQ